MPNAAIIEGSQDSLGYAWACAFTQFITPAPTANKADIAVIMPKPNGEFKHEVRQFEKSYDNQQAEQISLMV